MQNKNLNTNLYFISDFKKTMNNYDYYIKMLKNKNKLKKVKRIYKQPNLNKKEEDNYIVLTFNEDLLNAGILTLLQEGYFSNLGDILKLDLDMKFLIDLELLILDKFENYIEEYFGVIDGIYILTLNLLYNSYSYALLNHKNTVGQEEILNSFKGWDNMFSISQKLEILDDVCKTMGLDKNPYRNNHKKEKVLRKDNIIEFKKKIESYR